MRWPPWKKSSESTPTPEDCAAMLRSAPVHEVSLGCFGIKLVAPEELSDAQRGYKGATWSKHWLVIGHDTGMGDPYFVDRSEPRLPVYTAKHGAGSWSPNLVAASLDDFLRGLVAYQRISVGREHPVGVEANPIRDADVAAYKKDIRATLRSPVMSFWLDGTAVQLYADEAKEAEDA